MQDVFESVVVLSPPTATLLISFIIPLLTALLTKLVAPAWVKAICGLLLTTALGVVTLLSQAGVEGVPMKQLLTYIVVALVGSELAYNYLWKPLGAWALIQQWTSGFGMGGKASEQPLNPADVLTPPPGGFGQGSSARMFQERLDNRLLISMETGMGFDGEPVGQQVIVPLTQFEVETAEVAPIPKAPKVLRRWLGGTEEVLPTT